MTRLARSAYGLDTTPADDWRIRGACNQFDPELWTSHRPTERGAARWVCLNQCPVIADCRSWAYAHPGLVDQAVYGGLYWARPDGERAGTPRPAQHQPTPRPPGASRLRRDEYRPRRQSCLWPHLAEITAMYEAGMSTSQIAVRYGRNAEMVRRFAVRNNIRRPGRAK